VVRSSAPSQGAYIWRRSTYNLPLTQIQIGVYLGLTVVHVNRVLRSLRDDQIVNVEKHCVTILDIEQLRRLARNGPLVSANAMNERSLEVPMLQRDCATRIKDASVHPN
jgi:DNA-binding transcriptional regulator LsrR (DeoR family)